MIIFGLRVGEIPYKIATALAALVLISAGTLIWYVAPPWDPIHHEFSDDGNAGLGIASRE
jgi:hypothetical protein